MFKKIFSKKSGFTLVEVVVAFAVFAIMASMICQVLMMVVNQRSSNKKFADDLEKEEGKLIAQEKDYKIEADPGKTGELKMDFGENGEYNIGYQIKSSDGISGDGTGLNYFIGEVDYNASGEVKGDSSLSDNRGKNGAGQTARQNTRITGSRNIDWISVRYATKDKCTEDLKTGQTRYIFHVKFDSTSVTKEDEKYEQVKMYFFSDDTPVEATGYDVVNKQKKDYVKTVPKNASIVEVGYITNGAIDDSTGGREKANGSFATSTVNNPYKVEKAGTNIVRISSGKADNKLGSLGVKFYVVFDGDPYANTPADQIAASFGKNAVADTSGYKYTACPVYNDNGEDTGNDHVNIYGAYPYKLITSESEFDSYKNKKGIVNSGDKCFVKIYKSTSSSTP